MACLGTAFMELTVKCDRSTCKVMVADNGLFFVFAGKWRCGERCWASGDLVSCVTCWYLGASKVR
jgi:hypothetical protein